MKLASLSAGGRDGTLVVVSRDLSRAIRVPGIASTLQAALDDWAACHAELASVYRLLNEGHLAASAGAEVFAFDPGAAAAPLPRAYQFADGSAYLWHIELVRRARGAEMPPSFFDDPLMYQGLSDGMLGPHDDIVVADEAHGIDFEAEVAVITDDVPMGISAADAGRHVKLVTLMNDVSLRNLVAPEIAKGFGFFHAKPASAFAPVAATPDELGAAWRDARLHLPLVTEFNGARFGAPDAGEDMQFGFDRLIAHAARTRRLGAGTIIGSGTVSNRDPARGSSCIAERRTLEQLAEGAPRTPFMRFGDRVRIEMRDARGRSVFGAIDQRVARYASR
jgi:fumarylacetoacetate (FAA) hydrolase